MHAYRTHLCAPMWFLALNVGPQPHGWEVAGNLPGLVWWWWLDWPTMFKCSMGHYVGGRLPFGLSVWWPGPNHVQKTWVPLRFFKEWMEWRVTFISPLYSRLCCSWSCCLHLPPPQQHFKGQSSLCVYGGNQENYHVPTNCVPGSRPVSFVNGPEGELLAP